MFYTETLSLKDLKNSHGGKRAGSGMKKGQKTAKVRAKEIEEELFREFLKTHSQDYYTALQAVATGVMHMMGRNPDGTWTQVTDPEVMVKCLNAGESFYRLVAQKPDTNALLAIFNRLCGVPAQPKQTIDVNLGMTEAMLARLDAGRLRAAKKVEKA